MTAAPRKPHVVTPRPITVRLPAEQFAALEERAGEERGEGLPSVAQIMIARYLEIVRREKPLLSEQQWHVVRDALNGIWLSERAESIAWIDHEIGDAIRLHKLDEKHGINGETLLSAVRSWTYAQRVAVVDAVELWWRAQ